MEANRLFMNDAMLPVRELVGLGASYARVVSLPRPGENGSLHPN